MAMVLRLADVIAHHKQILHYRRRPPVIADDDLTTFYLHRAPGIILMKSRLCHLSSFLDGVLMLSLHAAFI